MATVLKDRVLETTTTTGTGNVSLGGAATGGFRAFSAVMANGDTTLYAIQDTANSAWEVGVGTYVSTGNQLARTTVLASSNSNALVSFAAGTKQVFMDFPGDRNLVVDSEFGINIAAVPSGNADPSTPASNFAKFFAKDIAGRVMPRWKDPDGIDYTIQPHIGFNRVMLLYPTTGASFSTTGGASFTSAGTIATPAITSTNLSTQTRRFTMSSGTTAGTVASVRQAQAEALRGSAAQVGGFHFAARFSLDTLASGNRAFIGMTDVLTAPTNVDPTTSTTPGKIGVAINASTGNWNFVTNVTGTAPTSTGLGANFPVDTTTMFTLNLYCPANAAFIKWRVTNETTGQFTTGSVTTNFPTATTLLAPVAWITNNATAANAILAISRIYLETDF